MSLTKAITTIMTRKGQSSRWDLRADVKRGTKKRRRREDQKSIREESQ